MQPGFSGTIRNQHIGSLDVKAGLIAKAESGPSEIMFELNALNDAVNALHAQIDHLEKALSPVVLTAGMAEQSGPSQPDPMRSPIGQIIHDRAVSVDAAMSRISALRNSLAV